MILSLEIFSLTKFKDYPDSRNIGIARTIYKWAYSRTSLHQQGFVVGMPFELESCNKGVEVSEVAGVRAIACRRRR